MSGNNPNPGLGEEQMKGGGGVDRREGKMRRELPERRCGECSLGGGQTGGDEAPGGLQATGGEPGQELSGEYVQTSL